jgi:hypothetical protein
MWKSEKMLEKYRGCGHFKNDYNSNDGMQSAIFGPAFWFTIHITSFNYPVNPSEVDKKNYDEWLRSIGKILPCSYCREKFQSNLELAHYTKKSLESRDSFSRFCYKLHCIVNNMLGKSSPTFKEVRCKYEMFRAKCLTKEEKNSMQHTEGCVRPYHNGERGKCLIKIVPSKQECGENIHVHTNCKPKSM